jgi:hypothetical protein
MGRKREVPPTPKEMVFRLASPEATAKLMQDTFNDLQHSYEQEQQPEALLRAVDYVLRLYAPGWVREPMPRDLGAGSVGKLLISPKPSV